MNNSYNFSERVRRVLSMAREESHRLEHGYVGTEHILLSLINDNDGVAVGTLDNLGIARAKVRDDLLKTMPLGTPDASRSPDLPYTSRAKKVLELSMAESTKLKHSYVGTEHLLLGILLEERGIAAQVLRYHGIDSDIARAEMLRILG